MSRACSTQEHDKANIKSTSRYVIADKSFHKELFYEKILRFSAYTSVSALSSWLQFATCGTCRKTAGSNARNMVIQR